MSSPTHLLVNPFTYGNEISDPAHFIGRWHEIVQIRDRLLNRESSSIVGERRIGKTSLLSMVRNSTFMKKLEQNEEYFVPIYIDLGMVGKAMTPTHLWRLFLENIKLHVDDTAAVTAIGSLCAKEQIDSFALNALFDGHLKRQNRLFTLLLDEFEEITYNPSFDESFFSGLRSLAIHHNLVLVTSSRAPLVELTHSKAIQSSPFFNIFANISLPLFKLEEAHQLIDQAMQSVPFRFRPDEVTHLIKIAGRHPFLVQIAGSCLFQAYSQGLDKMARQKYLEVHFSQEVDSHFLYLWQHSDDAQKIGLTALALLSCRRQTVGHGQEKHRLRQYFDDAKGIMKKLQRRGLVTLEDEYQLFSPIFADWIMGEIKASLTEPQEYKAWLQEYESQSSLSKFSSRMLEEVKTEVLPKVAASYRQLVIDWLSDPKTIANVVMLLRSSLS